MSKLRQHSVIPGFGLTLGYTLSYLSLIVLIPLSALAVKGAAQPWSQFSEAVFDPRTLAAWRLTFGTAFIASLVNAFFGLIVAWTLVRYEFPGRRILDALIDVPFALPTAVSGIALTAIYSQNGWMGRWLQPLGIKAAFSPRHRDRAHVYRPSLHCSNRAAGCRGSGSGSGRSFVAARRQPFDHHVARDSAGPT